MGVVLVVLVTGGKQSQLLVHLTWTGMELDWSMTKYGSSDGYQMALRESFEVPISHLTMILAAKDPFHQNFKKISLF